MTNSTILLAITGVFGGGRGTGGSPSKDKGTPKKWLDGLGDALKRLAGKAAETLPAITLPIFAVPLRVVVSLLCKGLCTFSFSSCWL